MGDRPYSSRAKRALDLADGAAATLGDEQIGTEHILLGLLDEKTGPAAQILAKLGVTSAGVRRELEKSAGPQSTAGAYCPRCGELASAGTRFCPRCGNDLSVPAQDSSVACATCGERQAATSRFCSKCGNAIRSARPGGTP
jgi:ATP-dependent Clp protease ATP-binding subunit ClpA